MGGGTLERDESWHQLDTAGGTRFQHPTLNTAQLKTYELFTCGIFHVIFLDCF